MHTFLLFCKIVKYRFRSIIEYPGAFIGGLAAQWLAYGIEMMMLFLIVWNFGTLAGWVPEEVIFLYALWLLSYAIAASFTFNICRNFPQMAINGSLDEAFIRPMSPIVYLIATTYNLGYISHIMITTAALIFSISRLTVVWSVLNWFWLFLLIITGAVIQGCMMLICDMPALRTRSQSPTGMFFWDVNWWLIQYPISIYPRPVQLLFTSILPFGFIGFYPVQVLLGKQEGILPEITIWLSPVVAVMLIFITVLCWRGLTSRYESAGT
ncbi:MAG: ABC-2 family transporter protein [Oscillospiraceae bacterium]|nr:ABC-2 family transporter protein [Oscillospiraceae bacterium]